MRNEERVLRFVHNYQARAYYIKILNWHEIVNDHLGVKRVAISFCSLCGGGMVFDTHVKNRNLNFGVSVLLYQSHILHTIMKQKDYGSKLSQRIFYRAAIGNSI
jgi:hypothetical protein